MLGCKETNMNNNDKKKHPKMIATIISCLSTHFEPELLVCT